MKTCRMCNQNKPLEDFHNNRSDRQGKGSWCKPCVKIYYQQNKNKYWLRSVKYNYGLTEQQYEELVEAHNVCALCGTDEKLFIDHDHETGSVRGMLCVGCNTAIGYYEKYKSMFEQFEVYLSRAFFQEKEKIEMQITPSLRVIE